MLLSETSPEYLHRFVVHPILNKDNITQGHLGDVSECNPTS